MNRENKETPGAGTPEVTVNLPGKRCYTAKEINDLLREVTAGVKGLAVGRVTRIDARSRVAEAEAALNEARLKTNDVELRRLHPLFQVGNRLLRRLQLGNRLNQRKS